MGCVVDIIKTGSLAIGKVATGAAVTAKVLGAFGLAITIADAAHHVFSGSATAEEVKNVITRITKDTNDAKADIYKCKETARAWLSEAYKLEGNNVETIVL